jgi:hypothetical protein
MSSNRFERAVCRFTSLGVDRPTIDTIADLLSPLRAQIVDEPAEAALG